MFPIRISRNRLAVVLVAMLGVLPVLYFTSKGEAQEQPPGLTAGVSSLLTAPRAGDIPPDVESMLEAFPPTTVGSAAEVRRSLRLLRSDLGGARRAIYAFRSQTGSVCFVVSGHSGVCPASVTAGGPGLLWAIGGGTESAPGSFAGVVSDSVSGISLVIDGQPVPVSIANNAAFADLPRDGMSAVITISYTNGSEEKISLRLAP